jgi:PAS domain S-box-containing protein
MDTKNTHNTLNEAVLQQLPTILWTTNKKLELTSLHGSLLKEFTIDINTCLGKRIVDIPSSTLCFLDFNKHIKAIKGDKVIYYFDYQSKAYQIELKPLLSTSQEIEGLIGMLTLTQKVVNSSQEDLQIESVSKDIPIPIMVNRFDDGRILYANSAAADVFRISLDELIGQDIKDYYANATERGEFIRRAKSRGGISDFEIRLKRKNGKLFWVQVASRKIEFKKQACFLTMFLDISSTKLNEQKWSRLVQQAPDYIFHLDQDYRIKYVNKKLNGKTVGQVMSSHIGDYIMRDSVSLILPIFERVKSGDEVGECEVMMEEVVKGGTPTWFNVRIAPIFLSNKNLEGFTLIATDISHLKKKQAELLASQAKNHAIINTLPDLMMIVNRLGVVLEYKSPDTFVWNINEEQPIVGENIANIFPSQVAIALKMTIQDTFLSKRLKTLKYNFWGEFFEARLVVIEGAKVLIVVRNITEQIHAEEHIVKNEKKYRSLVETMNEGLLTTGYHGRITYVNERFCQMLGYTPKELFGQIAYKFLLFGSEQSVTFRERLKQNKRQQYDLHLKKKDGEGIWSWLSSSPIMDENNQLTGSTMVLTDITSLKRAQLESTQVNNELEQLLYRASHDLKGPLGSIEGLINLMAIELKGEVGTQYLQMIRETLTKLNELISDLGKVSFIKKGIISVKAVNSELVIGKIIKAFSFYPRFDEIKITIDNQCSNDFYTDKSLLNTILQNLIENSIKYAQHIEYGTHPYLKITCQDTLGGITIDIEDNGIGIPEEVQHKIFDMFYRANTSSKGSGLGLYIVQNAVKKLGGSININSQEGKGTAFELKLPSHESLFNTQN